MGRSGGCNYWAHAGKISTGKVLRCLCLFLFCFARHILAFAGIGVHSSADIHSAATRRLRWRHHSSLAAELAMDYRKQKLTSSTNSGACWVNCVRSSWALLGHAADCGDKASDPGNTRHRTTTTATEAAAAAAAAAATPATTPPAAASATTANPVAQNFLTAAREERTNRDNAAQAVVLYFAFGANMSPSVLTGKRGVTPVNSAPAQAVAFATFDERTRQNNGAKVLAYSPAGDEHDEQGEHDEDGEGRICMSFSHRAGYATISERPGPSQSWEVSPGVYGVLHAVTPSDMERIAGFETGYRKRVVEVVTSAGERHRAICFVSDPAQLLPTSVPPTTRYLKLLQAGALHHGVDERYQSWLAHLPSVPSKEAEASPERTNTPSKILLNRVLALSAVVAAGATAFGLSGGFVNDP